jgi:BMFP domain-containing protein YqiC
MKKSNLLNDLAARLSDALPKELHSMKKDAEKNFHAILMAAFAKLELVTREEFDTQTKVLARTRKKLDSLEKELNELEKILKETTRKK